MDRKPDADGIRAFLRELGAAQWLGPQRRPWPAHVYHYSDVQNVASILRCGRIYSRTKAATLKTLDIASADIIEGSPWAHDYARLYFRPVTPTQYHNEGIRPAECRSLHSHCPVPVFLVFDAADLLTRADAQFTDGNLARHRVRVGDDLAFLSRLNFRAIYHDSAYPGSMSAGERDEITRCRCAEVIFEDEVDLNSLKEVVCRTPAERQTLLTLLGDARPVWMDRVRVEAPGERFFYRDWTFVREATLSDEGVRAAIRFGKGDHTVTARTRRPDGTQQSWEWPTLSREGLLNLPLPALSGADRVFLDLTICGCLAFRGYLSSRSLYL